MSFDNVFPLPRPSYSHQEIQRAVAQALEELGVRQRHEEEEDEITLTYTVAIPDDVLGVYGDNSFSCSCAECLFTVEQLDEPARWEVRVNAGDAQNSEAILAITAVAGRVSRLLGGGDEPELN